MRDEDAAPTAASFDALPGTTGLEAAADEDVAALELLLLLPAALALDDDDATLDRPPPPAATAAAAADVSCCAANCRSDGLRLGAAFVAADAAGAGAAATLLALVLEEDEDDSAAVASDAAPPAVVPVTDRAPVMRSAVAGIATLPPVAFAVSAACFSRNSCAIMASMVETNASWPASDAAAAAVSSESTEMIPVPSLRGTSMTTAPAPDVSDDDPFSDDIIATSPPSDAASAVVEDAAVTAIDPRTRAPRVSMLQRRGRGKTDNVRGKQC